MWDTIRYISGYVDIPKFLLINYLKSCILNGTDVLLVQKDIIATLILLLGCCYFPAHIVNLICNSCEINGHFYVYN